MNLYTTTINHHELHCSNGTILFSYDVAVACRPKGSDFTYVHENYLTRSQTTTRSINKYAPKGVERVKLTDEQFKLKLKEIVANG